MAHQALKVDLLPSLYEVERTLYHSIRNGRQSTLKAGHPLMKYFLKSHNTSINNRTRHECLKRYSKKVRLWPCGRRGMSEPTRKHDLEISLTYKALLFKVSKPFKAWYPNIGGALLSTCHIRSRHHSARFQNFTLV